MCFVYSMDVHSASSYYIVVYSYPSQIIQNMVKNFNVEEAYALAGQLFSSLNFGHSKNKSC